jgi:hypothetical protein
MAALNWDRARRGCGPVVAQTSQHGSAAGSGRDPPKGPESVS